MRFFESFPPYVSAADRKLLAEAASAARAARGQRLTPVLVSSRVIAESFWGQSWCQNLESYSDFENRLPRGRSYLRSGAVIDLKIGGGTITALVQGSSLYKVHIVVKSVEPARWRKIIGRCAGGLGSLVELLAGRISREVMTVVTERGQGLFPTPAEIKMSCSCPDWATMCKHVAATLYGAGARFDTAPELLFTLRSVDPSELIVQVGAELPRAAAAMEDVLQVEDNELGALFGIELADVVSASSTSLEEMREPGPSLSVRKKPRSAARASTPLKEEQTLAALKVLLRRLQRAEGSATVRRNRRG
jgi:uncharacterized Zn finger protein